MARLVIFYTLLVFDSLQLSVNYPTASAFLTRRVSHDLTLSCKIRRPRQACSTMKRLKHRVLGWAPGNPLARFWSCRQYYYYYEARYRENTPCCCSDLQSTTPFAEHYSCIIPAIIPELCFMLLQTDSSGNYAGILDLSLEMVAKCDK